ncbi:MAG: 3-ketoacyl-ACP reductase [Saprospiraceae bacterium]|nr:3-ketoacyl-ACP reductase [Saprospiraceae bacterium]
MNKYALITGGSRGIGLGIALQLASAGYHLAINGVRPESEVIHSLDLLRSKNIRVIYCQGNVALAEDRAAILHKIKSEYGALHVLVNNAGVAPLVREDLLKMSIESFERVMDINLKGPLFLTQQISHWMIDQKQNNPAYQAAIINVSSVSASVASAARAEYCISKAGVAMMSQVFAIRLSEYDIPVYEIRPGVIESDRTSTVQSKYDELIANGLTLQRRWGTPEDVGKAVLALAQGSFPYSTGQVFLVDGGLTVARF